MERNKWPFCLSRMKKLAFWNPELEVVTLKDLPYEVLDKIFKIILMLSPVYLLVTHAMRTRGYVV